jgi:hypothetical protein
MLIKIKNIFIILLTLSYFSEIIINSINFNPLIYERSKILGVPINDLWLIIGCIFFIKFIIKESFKIEEWILIIWQLVIIIIGIIIGVSSLNWNNINEINSDVRINLSFMAGMGLSFLIVYNKKKIEIKKQAELIVKICIISIIVSSLFYATIREINIYSDLDPYRIIPANIFIISGILIPIIIIFTPIMEKELLVYSLITLIIFLVILSGTRSMMIVTFVTYLIVIKLKKYQSQILDINKIKYFKLTIIILIILAISSWYFSGVERIFNNFSIKSIYNDPRFYEVLEFLSVFSLIDNPFGLGFGSLINSPIYNGNLTGIIHIGIFNFIMKSGLLGAGFIIYIILYVIIKSIKNLKLDKKIIKEDILLAKSSLYSFYPWFIFLIISGGYGETNFLMAGFALGIFILYKKNER